MVKSISGRWITLWMILAPFAALADNPATDVDKRFATMQTQIDALNKRLEQLERMLRSRLPPDTNASATKADVATAVAAPPPADLPHAQPELAAYQELEALRTNWKQLQRGLSRTELHQLLGKPDSRLTLDQQTLWYYRYPGIGGGSVMLDSKGKVTGWQKPPFRGW